jgi:glucose dehydrogenase
MYRRTVIAVTAAAAILGGAMTVAGAQESANSQKIAPAPAFDAEQLTALPRQNWITNGGNIFNQRYSPLTQINRKNVDELKAEWRTHMGSGDGPRNSGETQILAYEGVLYVSNGVNDVFAMDVETGEILWTYHANPNEKAGAPAGWANRGVALGDRLVFLLVDVLVPDRDACHDSWFPCHP